MAAGSGDPAEGGSHCSPLQGHEFGTGAGLPCSMAGTCGCLAQLWHAACKPHCRLGGCYCTRETWDEHAALLLQEGGKETCLEGCSAWESPPLGLVKWLVEKGQAVVFLKSSQGLKEPSKGRLMGPSEETLAEPPARANAEGPGAAALGLPWPTAGHAVRTAG